MTSVVGTRSLVASALDKLDAWIEGEKFQGWDPHDALNSILLRRLTLRTRALGILWLQLLKRSPFNFRPLLRVAKAYNPKAMGLFLASYLRKYRITGNPRYLEQVRFFARWLIENRSPGCSGASWGYNFDWPNRAFAAPAGTPTIVNTVFVSMAFLDMHHLLSPDVSQEIISSILEPQTALPGLPGSRTLSPLEIARSSCNFILQDLNLQRSEGEHCFSYTPLDRRLVHNANMLGALLLGSVYAVTAEPHLAEAARAAVRFTARRQREDGAWPYGDAANDHWVDNFHTGFVLVALKRTASYLQTDEFDTHLLKGYRFWKQRMVLPNGTPKYYPDQTYPIDIHSVAQTILTFLEFKDLDHEACDLALRVSRWGIEHMQDPRGWFHYQIHRRYTIRIPYMRWAQSWMQRGLTELTYQLSCIPQSNPC